MFFCKNKFAIILNIKNNAPIPTASRFVHYLSHSSKQTSNQPTSQLTTMSTINNTNYSPSGHNVQTGMLWELLSCASNDIIGDLISMKGDEEVKANFPEDYAEWVTNNQAQVKEAIDILKEQREED